MGDDGVGAHVVAGQRVRARLVPDGIRVQGGGESLQITGRDGGAVLAYDIYG
ncbi:hypothetical protein GCM10009745_08600 [Kribbella yunnanensis]|uniref:Uncharacterized protein n=1 Tax=Kribbella yunnanensis TaxID=190194 RepID=A0ABP4S7B0_9ACTN